MSAARPALTLTPEEQKYAIKTWRYLRLAMVALVAGLAFSVLYEVVDSGGFLTSISAYYYTPARGYFVGALVAIGVCLYCLEGSTELEDATLNLAGMLAPVVGLVPTTSRPPDPDEGTSVELTKEHVTNNMTAYLAVVGLAFVVIAVLTVRNRGREGAPDPIAKRGYGLAIALWAFGTAIFVACPDTFLAKAHYGAAYPMFGLIILVVALNAAGRRDQPGKERVRRSYIGVVAVMLAAVAVCLPLHFLGLFDHAILVVEAVLIVAFAVFWVVQTKDLWGEGLRPRKDDAGGAPPAGAPV
jgi:hypothetical protein